MTSKPPDPPDANPPAGGEPHERAVERLRELEEPSQPAPRMAGMPVVCDPLPSPIRPFEPGRLPDAVSAEGEWKQAEGRWVVEMRFACDQPWFDRVSFQEVLEVRGGSVIGFESAASGALLTLEPEAVPFAEVRLGLRCGGESAAVEFQVDLRGDRVLEPPVQVIRPTDLVLGSP